MLTSISAKPTFEGQSGVEPRMSHAPKIQQRGTEAAGWRHLWCQGLQDHHGSLPRQHFSILLTVLLFYVFFFSMESSLSSWISENLQCFAVPFLRYRMLPGKNKDSCRNCFFYIKKIWFSDFQQVNWQPQRCCRAISRKLRWVHDVPRRPTPSQHLRPSRGRRLRHPWARASSLSNQTKSFVWKTQTRTNQTKEPKTKIGRRIK